MHTIRNILFVPLFDDTDRPVVLDDAVRLAETVGAKFTIFDVVPDLRQAERQLVVGLQPSATELARSALHATFAAWAEGIQSRLPIRTDVEIGRRPLEVAQRVKRDDHDLVIVATGPSSFNHSTIRRLVRVCPCAVLIMRTPVTATNVVVAVDPFDPPALNRSILDTAQAHARQHATALHIVHAWAPDGLSIMVSNAPNDDVGHALLLDRFETEHGAALTELLDDCETGPSTTVHLRQGPPTEAILDTAEHARPALIVIGSCGSHGNETLALGKTTERLITATSSSVLLVRPPAERFTD